ncbi:MAG: response regulator [bacterium]|nr:response regulator [bacterium]
MSIRPAIFIIDDNKETAKDLAAILQHDYEVILTHNEINAVAMYESLYLKIRVVFLRIDLPNIRGNKLLSALKKISSLPEIIVFSEHQSITETVSVMKNGAYDYITTPFNKGIVLQKTESALEDINNIKKIDDFSKNIISSHEDINHRLYKAQNIILENQKYQSDLSEEVLSIIQLEQNDDIPASKHIKKILDKSIEKKKAKVLIVEDEEIYLTMLNGFLKHKYDTLLAKDGSSALKAFKDTPGLDLVLLDIFLPDTSGDIILKEFKKIRKEVDVIMITGFKLADLAVDTIKNGASDYINKPVLKKDLLATIEKTLYKKKISNLFKGLGKTFFEDHLTFESKINILNDLCKSRKDSGRKVFMEDIYIFFPELRDTCIPEGLILPDSVFEKGIKHFIDDIKSKIKHFNPLAA